MFQKFPQVSFVISTRNRCSVLLETLTQIQRCGLAESDFDIHVVDNASTDRTPQRVRSCFPKVKLIRLTQNRGSVAKNVALPRALGRFVVFLDDDSYPLAGSILRMIHHFESDAKLGAATFTVTLPDGRQECSAYPNVFIGCGVGFRRRALRAVGGLPDDFFMQAEEYDLSLRMMEAGYTVRTFEDLHVAHLKTPQARISSRTFRLDVRNNFYLIVRRFPFSFIPTVGWDWMKRYFWIAGSRQLQGVFLQGLLEGILRSLMRPRREPVSIETFERFIKTDLIRSGLKTSLTQVLGTQDLTGRPVLLVDCGKGIYGYWQACRDLGLRIVGIADQQLHHPSRRYRGIRLVDDQTGRSLRYDAVVISNLSPVHAQRRRDQWRLTQDRPVIDVLEVPEPDEINDVLRVESGFLRTVARTA